MSLPPKTRPSTNDGLEGEVKRLAKVAAAKRGVPLWRFLNDAVREVAQRDLRGGVL
ncbi:MAG TPA: hypothetical protein VJ021_00195 [Thermoplasmata archaeon]|nr:hypothetical protein [Thermoplasmata archaeon]